MKVRANAETPEDAEHSREVRRRGHRPLPHRAHVLRRRAHRRRARDDPRREAGRRASPRSTSSLPHQRKDFVDIFRIMGARPVTIRFLDPPLHEFLPHTEEDCADVAKATGLDAKALLARAKDLAESQSDARLPRLPARRSSIRKSTTCRRAPCSRPRATWPKQGAAPDPGNHDPVRDRAQRTGDAARARRRHRRGSVRQARAQDRLSRRHDDRTAARGAAWPARSPRAPTSSPSAPTISRRRRSASRATTPASSSEPMSRRACSRRDPFVSIDADGVGELVKHRRRTRPRRAQGAQARHLRRTRRRSRLGRVLRERRARLRVVFALPRADRAPGRGAGGAKQALSDTTLTEFSAAGVGTKVAARILPHGPFAWIHVFRVEPDTQQTAGSASGTGRAWECVVASADGCVGCAPESRRERALTALNHLVDIGCAAQNGTAFPRGSRWSRAAARRRARIRAVG